MFGTWKYDPETDEVQNLRQAFDPITARSSQHQACNRCHEKKLKCSGDKAGCDRCIANHLTCEYTRSNSRNSRRGPKMPRRRSGESSSNEVSPVTSRTTSTTSQKRSSTGQSRRRSPNQGHSPLPCSSSVMMPSHSAYDETQHRMLDSLDFSMLTPADAFDLNSLSNSMDHTRVVTCAPTSGSYLAPVTGSPISYHQPYDQDYHGYYQQSHSFDHVTSASATHPNMVTAGQGYAGDHEDDYMQYQHQHQAYQRGYWGGGQRGAGR